MNPRSILTVVQLASNLGHRKPATPMVAAMSEAHKRPYPHPKYKTAYRVRNWTEYEKSLRDRGDVTIWLSQDAIDSWTPEKTGTRDGQPTYSDTAIEAALTLRLIFHLPLRQTENFLGSIVRLMGLDLPCPDHTTLSRRNRTVNVRGHLDRWPEGPVCFIVDSTGLKICGQGEWHCTKHGEKQRKRWKKLHIGVDDSGWILASTVTDSREQDPAQGQRTGAEDGDVLFFSTSVRPVIPCAACRGPLVWTFRACCSM